MTWDIKCGDSLEVLKTYPENYFDSIVTDPPAGINFCNMEFDSDKGGSKEWVNWLQQIMSECFRTLKQGGYGVVWAIPRTSHLTATACENAGFDIKDVISVVVGKGFPHSHNISKAIDKLAGADRKVVGTKRLGGNACVPLAAKGGTYGVQVGTAPAQDVPITEAATPEAKQWEGWGTCLSPKKEHWILIQKPISEKSIARNVLKHGVGGLNIDACRVGGELTKKYNSPQPFQENTYGSWDRKEPPNEPHEDGRWPSNYAMVHSPDCTQLDAEIETSVINQFDNGAKPWGNAIGEAYTGVPKTFKNDVSQCVDWCPVAMLEAQAGQQVGKFFNTFYYTKASTKERNAGLSDFETVVITDGRTKPIDNPFNRGMTERKNPHPTLKSLSLMRYLCRLVTPKGGTIVDPFAGTMSTGCAAVQEGFNFLGIEKELEYFQVGQARIQHWDPEFIPVTVEEVCT